MDHRRHPRCRRRKDHVVKRVRPGWAFSQARFGLTSRRSVPFDTGPEVPSYNWGEECRPESDRLPELRRSWNAWIFGSTLAHLS
jgi:hypothetical protein